MKKIILIAFATLFSIIIFSSTIHVGADIVEGGDDFYVLKNNVKVLKDNLKVITDLATVTLVNEEWRKLESSGKIIINTDTMEATSNILNYDLKNDEGTLKENVETKINLEDEKVIFIFCDKINFNNKNKTYSGTSYGEKLVKIIKEDYEIYAKNFTYDENTKLLVLEDSVIIKNEKKNINMETSKATFKTDKNEISAQKVKLTLEIKDEEENK
jgi:lipopolysaccharide export system protein LptA